MVSKRSRSAMASAALTRIKAMDERRWERRSDAAAGRAPGRPKRGRAPSGGSERSERGGSNDRVEHLGLDLQLHLVLLQRGAVDQEGVLDALAEGRDLRQLQVDVVAGGEDAG